MAELASWPDIDRGSLPDKRRSLFLCRKKAISLYVATFGAQALGEMLESPPQGITPQPANASIALEHNLAVDKARREVGFWRCAGSVNLITEHFLSIQRTITEDR